MQEEKPNEGNSLDEGERLVLCAIRAILEVFQQEGFEEAAVVGEGVSTLAKLPGGGLHLAPSKPVEKTVWAKKVLSFQYQRLCGYATDMAAYRLNSFCHIC